MKLVARNGLARPRVGYIEAEIQIGTSKYETKFLCVFFRY